MLETLLCSLVTILPDYLFRRYVQGKRFGREITIYSVWFELRWGITSCVILTLSLITMIFYFHPATRNVTSAYRTVAVVPEIIGRVDEVYVKPFQKVKAGEPLIRLESSKQQAALDTAHKKAAQVDAQIVVARSQLVEADAKIRQAEAEYKQAKEDYEIQLNVQKRNSSVVAQQQIDQLRSTADARESELAAAVAQKDTLKVQIATLLPAEKESAEAQVNEAEAALDKTIVKAGVDGTLQQFTLRVGEVVNPLLKPAGVLVPDDAGRGRLIAGFSQIEAQVVKVGVVSEVTCAARPFAIIPMVVTDVQTVIANGQLRASDQLLDVQQFSATPGTITAILEPLYPEQYGNIPPGSSCTAILYTSTHEELASGHAGPLRTALLHAINTTALIHAIILRMESVMLPVKTLVLAGVH